jgi:hypothetical protein
MKMNLSVVRTALSVAMTLVLSMSVLADTVRLKDGSLIKGKIVNFADGRFTIVIGDGTRRRELSLSADEIASIEFDSPASEASQRNYSNESKVVPVSSPKPLPRQVITDNTNSRNDSTRQTDTDKDETPVEVDTTPATPSKARTTTNQPPITNIPNRTSTSTSSTKAPVSLNVRVLADNTANGWTNSGFVVKKGQVIRITASGIVSIGKGRTAAPSGLADVDDADKLLKAVPTGALIAVIGDDNNDFIYIGASREFTAGRDGTLYLGVNEGNLNDNSGSFDAKVEIDPQY